MSLTTIDITVSRDHIANGKQKLCSECPVALAAVSPIREAFPGATEIRVEDCALFFRTGGDDLMAASLPSEAFTFIHMFDRGHPVQPFTFSIFPVAYPVTGVAA